MTKPTCLSIFYEITMASLAILVEFILYFELTTPLTKSQAELLSYIDFSILFIFAVDYIYRFIRAEKKWAFFKDNIFDLIAIIPFDKAFRIARLARLGRLIRLSRLSKVFKLSKLLRIVIFIKKFISTLGDILNLNSASKTKKSRIGGTLTTKYRYKNLTLKNGKKYRDYAPFSV